ncbi:MAG: hypothetical protein Q8K28_20205 [Hoeflea sp.]|uniref:hypothetical protein n=1 Tax=Hoeflea sp. TaxID=1940281 RepID=UPI00272FBCE1|nr:hypothetical protein [Hoeflea sp.]MDP2122229.1 hypothetical protein [Hoeflea sp.]
MELAATVAYLAIIGLLGWRAWRGGDTEKVMFVVNVILLWISAIWLFGYPALIGPAVVAAGGFLLFLVVMTSSDLRVPVAARKPAEATEPPIDDRHPALREAEVGAARKDASPLSSAPAST